MLGLQKGIVLLHLYPSLLMLLTLNMAAEEHTGFQTLTQHLDIINFWQQKMLCVLDCLCENGGIEMSSIQGYNNPPPHQHPPSPSNLLCLPLVRECPPLPWQTLCLPLVGECPPLPWQTLCLPFPHVLPAEQLDHVSTDVVQGLDSF